MNVEYECIDSTVVKRFLIMYYNHIYCAISQNCASLDSSSKVSSSSPPPPCINLASEFEYEANRHSRLMRSNPPLSKYPPILLMRCYDRVRQTQLARTVLVAPSSIMNNPPSPSLRISRMNKSIKQFGCCDTRSNAPTIQQSFHSLHRLSQYWIFSCLLHN